MAFKKSYGGKYQTAPLQRSGSARGTFRVKTSVRSFRDLDVYKQTTQLSSDIYKLKLLQNLGVDSEVDVLRALSKQIPRFIAESYGDKFTSRPHALQKLERSMRYISDIIVKIDFLLTFLDDADIEAKEALRAFVQKYQTQRIKILNLKRAWERMGK